MITVKTFALYEAIHPGFFKDKIEIICGKCQFLHKTKDWHFCDKTHRIAIFCPNCHEWNGTNIFKT